MARNSLIQQAYAKSSDSEPGDDAYDDPATCPHCGQKRIESIAPTKKAEPVDTVGVKKRMAADVQQGAKQKDDVSFLNRQESGDPKARRATDEAQAALNRTAAAWQARADTLTAARAKKGRK